MPSRLNIHIEKSREDLANVAAKEVIRILAQAIEERGGASLVLSGGETPRRVYQILGSNSQNGLIAWDRVQCYFGDERMVPPDHPESNFGMALRELFNHVPIPKENVHRIHGELVPDDAAIQYAEDIRTSSKEEVPRFDCVMLGIGEDGHTASLFPGTNALHEKKKTTVALFAPRIKSWRVTLTFPVINNAGEVMFLAEGEKKASIIQKVIETGSASPDIPATMVHPHNGVLHWMIDSDAASRIR